MKVKTIDGFQGGERDINILSTVRTKRSTSLQFISNHHRTKVALTRARHSLLSTIIFFHFLFCPKINFCISLDIWSNAEIMILNRYFLLILGNERTLTNEENVWKSLVLDAKKRRCFFNADEDKELAKSIWDTKKELDQLDDLLNPDSFLFKKSRWKVFVISFLKFYIFFLLSIFQSCF